MLAPVVVGDIERDLDFTSNVGDARDVQRNAIIVWRERTGLARGIGHSTRLVVLDRRRDKVYVQNASSSRDVGASSGGQFRSELKPGRRKFHAGPAP